MGSFGTQVKAWTKKAKRKRKLIMGRSIDLLTDDMLDNTQVLKEYLKMSYNYIKILKPKSTKK